MTICSPCVGIPSRRLKLIFTPDPAKPTSWTLKLYSLDVFGKPPSCALFLIFTPVPKESSKKVLHEPMKMTIQSPCVEIPSRRLKLFFSPDAAKSFSVDSS